VTNRAAIALGSNLGDRLSHLRFAIERLRRLGTVAAVSSVYETAPVGGPEQGPYLNAVVVVDTPLSPAELLAATQAIEADAGRVRVERWGPRTLDLDIVTMVDGSGAPIAVEATDLQIPHPRAHQRRFVLEPLAEVWPDAPLVDATANRLLPAVTGQEVERLGRGWEDPRRGVAVAWLAAQLASIVAWAALVVATAQLPPPWVAALPGVVLAAGGLRSRGVGAGGDGRVGLPSPRARRGRDPRGLRAVPVDAPSHLRRARRRHAGGGGLRPVGRRRGRGGVVGVLLWLKARYEETRLRMAVPGYVEYSRRVRGRMVPLPPYSKPPTVLR